MTTTTNTPTKNNVICIDSGRLRFREQSAQSAGGKKSRLDWNGWRTTALALCRHNCAFCFGLGHRIGRQGVDGVCACVFRRIFAVCLEHFHYCHAGGSSGRTTVVMFQSPRGGQPATWSLKNEEYAADFELLAFRTLNGGRTKEQLEATGAKPSLDWQVFVMHLLHGQPWYSCCGKLGLDRGNFYHRVYRIQTMLGLAFVDTIPHPLFPIDEYNSPATREKTCETTPAAKPMVRRGFPAYKRKVA